VSDRWAFHPLEKGVYQVILADPPWQFHAWSHRGKGRGASQHYKTMSAADIAQLPVQQLAADNAALFMWVVQPQLPEALALIEAWGFSYKTIAYCWVKIKGSQRPLFLDYSDFRIGLGYHTRAGMELCLLAVRGKGYRRQSQSEAQVFVSPIRQHSRKPDEIPESIIRLTGDVRRVELFARAKRVGWDSWGAEVGKFG